jgi:hypothetical protein
MKVWLYVGTDLRPTVMAVLPHLRMTVVPAAVPYGISSFSFHMCTIPLGSSKCSNSVRVSTAEWHVRFGFLIKLSDCLQ